MKRLVFALLTLSLVFVSGCSKNSDDDNPEEEQIIDKTPNLQATGSSANDILSNTNFDKLLIEIAFVDGFRPTQTSMDNFTAYLQEHTFKENIELIFKSLPSPNEETLELQEVADLESENRTAYNDGRTLAIYIYFADAPAEDDDPEDNLVTLGAVYRNTSMIIYESSVRNLANRSGSVTITDVESATLNHEFGHLFGLVNLGTTPVNNHEDAEAANHCNVTGCLMRAELQFGGSTTKLAAKNSLSDVKAGCSLSGQSVLRMLELQTAKGTAKGSPALDAECVLDLQSNGGR